MKGKLSGLHTHLIVYALLTLVTLAAFLQVFGHDFTNWDDDKYVTRNPHVQRGLTWDGISWAFTAGHASNWHPLTWISHMLDRSLFGTRASGPHAANLLLHIANTILLFAVLRRMTGFVWRSAFVAALFAVHPLHVESVAWVAERKDVLSTLFWMLTMLAYVRYTERPGIGKYALVAGLFALGLMAKPMLVTLPFVLLLMDYWPLRRISRDKGWPFGRLVLEKIPLIALSAASSVVTYVVQQRGGSMAETELFTAGVKVSNALVAYATYVLKMFWPVNLITPYLHRDVHLPLWQIVASASGLVILSGAILIFGRRRPYLSVGWLWFLGTLAPVIGLVQVGFQSMADRYTYVPLIGLFIVLTWGIADLCSRFGRATALCGLAVIAVLTPLTWRQAGYWRNGQTLFEHTLAVDPRNEIAHNNLGVYLEERGKLDEAEQHFVRAIEINPQYAYGHLNLGNVYSRRKDFDKARACYEEALESNPGLAEAHANIGNLLAETGGLEDSVEHFELFLERYPDQPNVLYNLGKALMAIGRTEEAIERFGRVIELDPGYAEAHYNLGLALKQTGNLDGAIEEYRETIRLDPKHSESHNNLANILLSQQKYDEAIAEYREAIRLKPTNAEAQNNLAGAYYFKCDYESARRQIESARKAGIALNPKLIELLSEKMRL